jgi:hypothetical protein
MRIFRPWRDVTVTGRWRGLLNEELHNLYSSPIIIRMRRAYSMNGEKSNACRILVGKPERKRSLRKPRHRWVDNIKMDLGVMVWYGPD